MRGGINIYIALKDILFQVLVSVAFPLFLTLVIDKFIRNKLNTRIVGSIGFTMVVVVTYAICLIVCFIFSSTLYGVVPINLGILLLYFAILYGRYKAGIPLILLYIALYFIFTQESSIIGLLFHTGLIICPLMFIMSSGYLKVTFQMKLRRMILCLLPTMLLVIIVPILTADDLPVYNVGVLLVLIGYLILTMLSGAMHVYLSEILFVQLLHNEQLITISEKYMREEEKLQQVMDVAPLCMVSFNRNGEVTSINEMMMNLLKKQNPQLLKKNVLGNSISMFASLVEQGVIELQLAKALKGNTSEHELNYSNSRTYYTSCSPLTNTFTGEIIGAVLVIQDITELERLRSELGNVDRLSLVGQMAASITHEIRNPMAVVRGFMQLMREKSPGSLDHYYRIVMEELDRMNGIINDFLSLAQNRVSEMEDCHLHTIINELNPLLSEDANLRGHTILLDLDENVPELRLNAKEIKQLILNLARNGMEAMDDKGQLTLQTKMSLNSVDLIIKDSGSGITQNELDQLFVPFFTTKEQGTGLGLVLCLSIVERHKGKITVDSKVGVGTMFTVEFPRGISVIEHNFGA